MKYNKDNFLERYKLLIHTIVNNNFQEFKDILGDDDLELGVVECLICSYLASVLDRPEILALLSVKIRFLFLYNPTYSLSFFHAFCKMLCTDMNRLPSNNLNFDSPIENLMLVNTLKLIQSEQYSKLAGE